MHDRTKVTQVLLWNGQIPGVRFYGSSNAYHRVFSRPAIVPVAGQKVITGAREMLIGSNQIRGRSLKPTHQAGKIENHQISIKTCPKAFLRYCHYYHLQLLLAASISNLPSSSPSGPIVPCLMLTSTLIHQIHLNLKDLLLIPQFYRK